MTYILYSQFLIPNVKTQFNQIYHCQHGFLRIVFVFRQRKTQICSAFHGANWIWKGGNYGEYGDNAVFVLLVLLSWWFFWNQIWVLPILSLLAPTGALYVMVSYCISSGTPLFEIFTFTLEMISMTSMISMIFKSILGFVGAYLRSR